MCVTQLIFITMQLRIPSGRKNNQCWRCFACRIQGANYLRKLWKSWVDVDFPTGEEGKTGLQVMAHGPPSVEMSHQWLYCRKFCFQSFRLHEDRAKTSSEDLERRSRALTRAKISSEDLERELERRPRANWRRIEWLKPAQVQPLWYACKKHTIIQISEFNN